MIDYKSLPELAIKYICENFKVGDRLPAQRQMIEIIGINRSTYREALAKLEVRGVIKTVHGLSSVMISSPLGSEEHY